MRLDMVEPRPSGGWFRPVGGKELDSVAGVRNEMPGRRRDMGMRTRVRSSHHVRPEDGSVGWPRSIRRTGFRSSPVMMGLIGVGRRSIVNLGSI